MLERRRTVPSLIAVAGVAALVAVATPAQAAVKSFTDQRNDGSNPSGTASHGSTGDIGAVTLALGHGKLAVRVAPARGGTLADQYLVYISTDSDKLPELLITATRGVGTSDVDSAQSWSSFGGTVGAPSRRPGTSKARRTSP